MYDPAAIRHKLSSLWDEPQHYRMDARSLFRGMGLSSVIADHPPADSPANSLSKLYSGCRKANGIFFESKIYRLFLIFYDIHFFRELDL